MLWISWVAERFVASQKGLSSMELVCFFVSLFLCYLFPSVIFWKPPWIDSCSGLFLMASLPCYITFIFFQLKGWPLQLTFKIRQFQKQFLCQDLGVSHLTSAVRLFENTNLGILTSRFIFTYCFKLHWFSVTFFITFSISCKAIIFFCLTRFTASVV
jgi:hypothetical protein